VDAGEGGQMNIATNLSILSDELVDNIDLYRAEFENAKPFRHVLIAPFFNSEIAEAMLEEFPVPVESEMRNEFGKRSRKYACHDVRSIGPTYRLIDDYVSSPKFAQEMQRLTGIEGLLYDPEYHGAGTHDNFSGQGMDAHVDFNLHRTTGYHRRFNAIIYLNKEWDETWGGCLEVHKNPWDFENDTIASYPPHFNHCVLFETNEISWHGFQRVQKPDGRELSRKSFTIYMYTKDRPKEEIAPKHGTIYVQAGPPKQLKAGYTVKNSDVQELTALFKARNAYLQGMYERESKLMEQVEAAKRLRVRMRVPTIGYVRQEGPGAGIEPGNNAVSENASISFKALCPVMSVTIRGRLAQHVARATLAYTVAGQSQDIEHIEDGQAFELPFQVNVDAGKSVGITIDVKNMERKPGFGAERRTVLFVDEIQFD
jgi:Rps23 Pro-64 3,4-dihydroxylase Tpa1-like proline 4-hydroxylase